MKNTRWAALAALLAGCAATGPTTVPATQREHVARDVQQWHDVKHPECRFEAVAGTRVLRQDGPDARELWTIAACGGRRFDYVVSVRQLDDAIWDTVADPDAAH